MKQDQSNHRQIPDGHSNHQGMDKREEVGASDGPAKKFSLQQTISIFSHRLARRGNAWMATLTPNQQRALLVVFLFTLACYFVVLSGKTFLSGAVDQQKGLPRITPMPDPLPRVAPQANSAEGGAYQLDSLPLQTADSTSSF